MNDNQGIKEKIIRKVRNIKLKYRYENNRLKSNRKILEQKIFSPQRRSEQMLNSNENVFTEYSLNSIGSARLGRSVVNGLGVPQSLGAGVCETYTNTNDACFSLTSQEDYHSLQLPSEIDPRKLESLLSAPNGSKESNHKKSEEFNPRETQTNYNKTRLPQIHRNEIRSGMMSPEPLNYYSKGSYRIDPTEASTHESSHRAGLESRGMFKEYRNSVNMDNEEYQQIKHNMDQEVKESPGYKFGNRKSSVKIPPHIPQYQKSKPILAKNNSTGQLRVFKIQVDGNQIRKKEIKHNEFLAEISQKKTRNTKMFKMNANTMSSAKINSEKDFRSLSPKKKDLEEITKRLENPGFASGSISNHEFISSTISQQDPESPLILMDSSTGEQKKSV